MDADPHIGPNSPSDVVGNLRLDEFQLILDCLSFYHLVVISRTSNMINSLIKVRYPKQKLTPQQFDKIWAATYFRDIQSVKAVIGSGF